MAKRFDLLPAARAHLESLELQATVLRELLGRVVSLERDNLRLSGEVAAYQLSAQAWIDKANELAAEVLRLEEARRVSAETMRLEVNV